MMPFHAEQEIGDQPSWPIGAELNRRGLGKDTTRQGTQGHLDHKLREGAVEEELVRTSAVQEGHGPRFQDNGPAILNRCALPRHLNIDHA